MRIVIDTWIDFGDPWSYLALHRLHRAAATSTHNVAIDVHSFIGPGSSFSPDDAERLASLMTRSGLAACPERMTNVVPQELRHAAHRGFHQARASFAAAEAAQTAGASPRPEALTASAEATAARGVELAQNIQALLLGSASMPGIDELARVSGVGVPALRSAGTPFGTHCEVDQAIELDIANAKRLGISGLPLVVVAGRLMAFGAQTTAGFTNLIDEAAHAIKEAEESEAAPEKHRVEL